MSSVILLFVFLIICAISAASFAADRNRNQAGWFLIGFLAGPIGLLILLLLRPSSEAVPAMTGNRLLLATLATVAVLVIAVMSVFEAASQYQESHQFGELEAWRMYGDALIRFAEAPGKAPDAFLIRAARDQIAEHERELRDGMNRTESELLLAVRGVSQVRGAAGVLINVYRVLTLRGPEWPAPKGLSTRSQEEVVQRLNRRLEEYQQYIKAIEDAKENW